MNEPPPASDHNHEPALRILDANANRAAEAIRVVEEYCRFVRDDSTLADACKQLRHDLAEALSLLPHRELLRSRNTAGDVGAQLTTEQEYQRDTVADVAAANCKRLEQSLRSLEEYGKVVNTEFARCIELLRYRAYDLAPRLLASRPPNHRLLAARLYLLVDGCASEAAFARLVQAVLPAVDVIQLRDKQLDDRRLLARARTLRELTANANALMIVNDRPDLAVLADSDGVHVGQDELPIAEVRRIVPDAMLVGVSTHSIEQAREAAHQGADYLGCGPVFASGTKSFERFPGPPFLRQVSAELSLPAFAIGGIDETNLPEVLATGFIRIAVSGPVLRAAEPSEAAQRLRRARVRGVNLHPCLWEGRK